MEEREHFWFFYFHSIQGWTATTRSEVTRKRTEKRGKVYRRDNSIEPKYKMCLLTLEKNNGLVLKFCVFLKYFIILEFRTKFQLPAILLSLVSRTQYNEGLFIKLFGCHCWCFMINNKNHNKWWGFPTRKMIFTFLQHIH